MTDAMSAARQSEKNLQLASEISRLEQEFLANPSKGNFKKFHDFVKKADKESRSGMFGDPGLGGISSRFPYINSQTISSDVVAKYVTGRCQLALKTGHRAPIIYTIANLISKRCKTDVAKVQDEIKGKVTMKQYENLEKKILDDKLRGRDVEKIAGDYISFPIKPIKY